MRLILSLTGGGLSGPATMRTLSEGSVTIGRGARNGWVLPDPQQLMSRTHCAVSIEGSRAILTDLSSNGVFVNGARQPTERDMRIVLTDGDSFAFGDYTFKVVILDDGAAHSQGSGAFPAGAFPNASSFEVGGRDARSPIDVDPLADPLGRPADGPDPFAIAPNPAFSHPIAHVAVNPRGTPDPFDSQPQRSSGFDDQDMFRGQTPSPDWNGLPQADHAPATSAAMPVQRVVNPMSMDDFDKLLGGLDVPKSTQSAGAFPPSPASPPQAAFGAPMNPAPLTPGMLDISLDDLLGTAPTPAPAAPSPAAIPVSSPVASPAMPVGPATAREVDIDDLLGSGQPPVAMQPAATHPPVAQDPFEHPGSAVDPFQAPSVPLTAQPPTAAAAQVGAEPFHRPAEPPVVQPIAVAPLERATPLQPTVPRVSHNPFEDPEPVPGTPRGAPASFSPPGAEVRPTQPLPTAPVSSPVAAPAVQDAVATTPPTATGMTDDLLAGFSLFLEGAGIAPSQVDSSNPAAAMRAAGAVFRAMAEGLREVLISRTEIKSEMRVERTMISSHGNNALKFSVTPDDAVIALLTQKRPGYMPPLAATKEAFSDIKQHELAVMAGVQTALMDLLKRFEPEVLEKRLSPSALGAILPAARKARYWDGFQDAYKQISQEAEDDFQSIFGRSFAKAYTAQTRKE